MGSFVVLEHPTMFISASRDMHFEASVAVEILEEVHRSSPPHRHPQHGPRVLDQTGVQIRSLPTTGVRLGGSSGLPAIQAGISRSTSSHRNGTLHVAAPHIH